MSEVIIEIHQPGRPIGEYQQSSNGYLILKQIIYPEEHLPFDIGYIPETLSDQGELLPVLLIGETSHPPHSRVEVRLLGGIRNNGTISTLLAVAKSDKKYQNVSSINDLNDLQRDEIINRLKMFSKNGFHWLNQTEIDAIIKQARKNYRLVSIQNSQEIRTKPAWKPADSQRRVTDYTEIEHYTAAEYTFFQLPYHIQHYVSEYLDEDERILYAIQRPAMRSNIYHSWLGREKLQEGVLILTTQRLIQLVELVPLSDSGVRYGFNAQIGVVERLVDFSVEEIKDESVIIRTEWRSKMGKGLLEWETPLFTRSKVLDMLSYLEKFTPAKIKPNALQRSSFPAPAELPLLRDPASNDPQSEHFIHQRFANFIPSLLSKNEKIYTWALIPAWFENNNIAHTVVITNSRIMLVADPNHPKPLLWSVPLVNITTLEYVGSVMHSYIGLHVDETEKTPLIKIKFPYSAEIAFHRCFETIRRCMAVLPLA